MSCRYCLHEKYERSFQSRSSRMNVNHDGSLEYITGRDLYSLLTMLLSRLGNSGAGSEGSGPKQGGLLHLIPYQNKDGSTDWVNGLNYRTVAKTGVKNRAPYYFGPENYLTKLGGRGEYSEIAKMYEDGDYFHTRKK